ncbi:hypothetical protein KOW79_012644 [Hemibagrus wyckioides]|uniref:UPAR/Ly6 domain-containing protein n=1 Tax=Hemibagrus wyckioides TaxID=337641 RepID=A0A9D3NNU6_9TELE|nr:sperm acrosome membrane-associated protein 4-like [Hemibagrus wyckioides]KAG7324628.1 hypothetical protein KOW79_012644 [Hemibagrus wyckioides]
MSSSTALLFLILLSLLASTAVCLTCYTCVFSSISPLECQMQSNKCAAGERCLYATATAEKDSRRFVLNDKSCATPSKCGVTGEKRVAGLVFTFTTRCCDTDLCNAAAMTMPAAPCWSQMALSLVCMALTSLLASA